MTDFLQNGDLIAHVFHLLQPDHVDHGEDFQCEVRTVVPAEDHSAERACAWKSRWRFYISFRDWHLHVSAPSKYPQIETLIK